MNLFDDFSNVENIYIDDYRKIELITIEKISDINKIDNIILKHYGEDGMGFLKLILAFNNLPDISLLNNKYIKIPDLLSLINNIEIINLEDDKINGVTSLYKKHKNVSGNKNNITVGNPKLNIELPKVNYDESTGILKF